MPPSANLIPRSLPGRQRRRPNFRMSEPALSVRRGDEVALQAPPDSRAVYVFFDQEGGRPAPFGEPVIDLAPGEQRSFFTTECAGGKSYRYVVYLVDHDDLADGNSAPRIVIMG